MLLRQQNYDGAIACLMTIPSCLTVTYQEALEKAGDVLTKKEYDDSVAWVKDVCAYNDSVLSVAKSYAAQHNASAALDALSAYMTSPDINQNKEYQSLIAKSESLVSSAEREAAREKRQKYLDDKAREQHQWAVDDQERAHRMNMDNQQMAYNRAALASNERITTKRIEANERLTSQRIASDERLSSQRINAIKTIAVNYYKNNQTRTIDVNHNY